MSMYDAIVKTIDQFTFRPKIENEENLKNLSKYIIVGMGGSGLAIGLVKTLTPDLDVIGHQNYGLPNINKNELQQRLIIFSSYSGNTEEVVDSFIKAGEMGLNRAVISVGGKLLELAKKENVPYVQMPNWGIQPRSALVLSFNSFLKFLKQEDVLLEMNKLGQNFKSEILENKGKEIATTIQNRVPIIYTSTENEILGYIWKITLNETGKIPAFNNVFPELNHNEINGFGVEKTTIKLSENFYFIFLRDDNDNQKINKRMEITAKLYNERNLPSKNILLEGNNKLEKIFYSMIIAEFTAYFTAMNYGLEPERVPMIEDFKKILS